MMLFVLGILDILSALVLFLLKFGLLGRLGLVVGIYLIVKGFFFLFSGDWLSLFDIFTGLFIFYFLISGNFLVIGYVFMVWLLQKGIFSLLG